MYIYKSFIKSFTTQHPGFLLSLPLKYSVCAGKEINMFNISLA